MFTNKHKICIYLFIHARKNVKLFNYDKVEKYQKFCRIFKEFFEDLFLCFIFLQKWKHFHTKLEKCSEICVKINIMMNFKKP